MAQKKSKIRVYEYSNCSTCKKALRFLDGLDLDYQKIGIVEQPPTAAELKRMAGFLEGGYRKLFNTSGVRYRELGMSEKLKTLSEADALRILAKEGKLVKRPFLLTEQAGTVGFNPAAWRKILA